MITLDFETEAIVGNPILNPPRPVGLAIRDPYYGTEYVTEWARMQGNWQRMMANGSEVLFHNAPFDLSVGMKWLGGQWPSWEKIHDTMYPLYMLDPYANSYALKESADRYLFQPPEEQDKLKAWILAHVPEATEKTWGAYICEAPVEIVEPYAIGDVNRTHDLYEYLMPKVSEAAYDRERKLMPIMIEGTQRGIRIDRENLELDIVTAEMNLTLVDDLIYKQLGYKFNIGSPMQLADALDKAGAVSEWIYTDKGNRSTAKDNLALCVDDKTILSLLAYRSGLDTCIGTFMKPWMAFSELDGRVHPEWNQVKHTESGRKKGTRTGRLSSNTPNFQNVPNVFEMDIIEPLTPLPMMREYCLPEEGQVWLKRDFSSQEIRILAHFEDEQLARRYQDNPMLDPHATAMELMKANTGILYPRKDVKIVAFMMVYGGGIDAIAKKTGRPNGEAYNIRQAYYAAFPGVKDLQKDTAHVGRRGEAVTTWGGRKYYKEPHKLYDFSYKLLNYLIQGSAADQTKQCIIDWDDLCGSDSHYLATVHDEINISVPVEQLEDEMAILRDAMEQDLFDVPMRSEGFVGDNWHNMEGYDETV